MAAFLNRAVIGLLYFLILNLYSSRHASCKEATSEDNNKQESIWKLYVLGRTRVGKGEFISQAVKLSGGVCPDITSARLESHTGTHSKHRAFDLYLVDTVGYEDSEDRSEEAMLRLLADTGTEPFYPPLLLIRDLSQSDVHWMDIITRVFPRFVFAVRGSPSKFRHARESLTRYQPLKIFHLNEFLEGMDETKKVYIDDVKAILDYYSTLEATREDINFESDMFQGTISKTDTGYEMRDEIRTEDNLFEHEMPITRNVPRKESVRTGEVTVVSRGGLSGFLGLEKTVIHYQDIMVDNFEQGHEEVQFQRLTKYRDTYRRTTAEVWKVLVSGIKIFKHIEFGEWEKIRSEVIEDTSTKTPAE